MNNGATVALAAGKLRIAAENAARLHPGPWNADGQIVRSAQRRIVVDRSTSRHEKAMDIPFIALMDPNLGSALADWLEAASLHHDMGRDHDGCDRQICASAAALAVARAILGGTS